MAKQKKSPSPAPASKAKGAPSVRDIWMICREYEGLAGVGGVKDVCRQSAEAFARKGCRITVVLPCYGFLDPKAHAFAKNPVSLSVDMHYVGTERREALSVWEKKVEGVRLFLLDAARFREKMGVYTYTEEEEKINPFNRQGAGHFDYFATNVLLQKGVISLIMHLAERPDIIHCHDGHTALLPAIIREVEGFRHYFHATGVLVTIHNAGRGYHQEVDDLPFARAVTGLPQQIVYGNLLNGSFDPILAAADYAVLNTVSENYARELQETDQDSLTGWLGHKLLRRGITLRGITNGINPRDFDCRHPQRLGLAASFDPLAGELAGKKKCRQHLVASLRKGEGNGRMRTGWLDDRPDGPLFTFVGRLTTQKGVDKLLDALESLMILDPAFQVVILGSGPRETEKSLEHLARQKGYRGRIAVLRGYDPVLANQVYAAGDFFLIPSQYEPCGLTDFIAQLFGNLPIVHHTGGLVKVQDGVNGFAYADHSSAALMGAMQKAIGIFRREPERIRSMQREAVRIINERYSWDVVIEHYLELYRRARTMAAQKGC